MDIKKMVNGYEKIDIMDTKKLVSWIEKIIVWI